MYILGQTFLFVQWDDERIENIYKKMIQFECKNNLLTNLWAFRWWTFLSLILYSIEHESREADLECSVEHNVIFK